ncbi:MAG: hypothetical protein AAGG72_09065, partial [Pseudomonadota bacterium]
MSEQQPMRTSQPVQPAEPMPPAAEQATDPVAATKSETATAANESAPISGLKDWRVHRDIEKIVWISFDRAGESANALGRRPIKELIQIVDYLERAAAANEIVGAVLKSAKPNSFIVGADINE